MADVVFHSSGSTGPAKSIVRTEASLMADARQLVEAFPEIWSAHPFVISTVRSEHMFGALWRVRAPQLAGCRVCEEVLLSVEEILGAIAGKGPALFVTTPSFLAQACTHPDFPKLRGAISEIVTSGSALGQKTAQRTKELTDVAPLEIYGSTETGTVAFRRSCQGEAWTLLDGVFAAATDDGLMAVDSPFALSRPFVLNDRVAFVDARRFLLKGRADRQVKILEHMVSLGKVEEALAAHPFVSRVRVEAFGSGVSRLGALIELTAEGAAALAKLPLSNGAALLREHVRGKLSPHEIPRRIRFVHCLPTNSQGKTTVEAVVDALEQWCPEPFVLSSQITETQLNMRLAFPADMVCFKGHFPSFPILPGVAQLYFIRHFVRRVFPDFPDACAYRKLKFKRIVMPSAEIDLTIVRKGEGRFEFVLGEASQGEVVAK